VGLTLRKNFSPSITPSSKFFFAVYKASSSGKGAISSVSSEKFFRFFRFVPKSAEHVGTQGVRPLFFRFFRVLQEKLSVFLLYIKTTPPTKKLKKRKKNR